MTIISQKSFTGGVISPSLFSRCDLVKYQTGLKTLKNGFVKQEGCVTNRSGLQFVYETKDHNKKCRLIPFSFNTEQTYIIEFGNHYARFYKDGGIIIYPPSSEHAGDIVEIETPYDEDDLMSIKYAQNADVLTLCHKNYKTLELTRQSHHEWSLNEISINPTLSPPNHVVATYHGSTSENTKTYKYVVTAVTGNDFEESNRSSVASCVAHLEGYFLSGEYIDITWNSVSGAFEYSIYKEANGVYGYIGTSNSTSFRDTNIEPDLTTTAPILKNPFEDNNNPTCVSYFQQRKIFGGLKNNTQSLVASQTGTDDNFNISRPLNATDSINISISEREVNEIRHLIGLNDLVVLTSGAEWKVNGVDGTFSANSNLIARAQSFYGSSHIQPVVSGNMIIFVQAGGSIVRDLGYEYMSDSYNGDELTIFSNHIFENKKIVDMAYSKEPYRILWCVMNDGTINALTYNKKQEIFAWHTHETKGQVESVAVIRENDEDVPYFIVKRKINNQDKRYVERMSSRLKENCFLDSSLSYEGPKRKAFSGLDHLDGHFVTVLADFGVVENVFVENGSFELDEAASSIVVGIPYEFELETLNIEGSNTFALKKNILKVGVKVDNSREDFFIVGSNGEEIQNPRSINSINDANYLYSGLIEMYPFSNFEEEVSVHLKQKFPLPLTITSITTNLSMEGIDEETGV